MKKVKVLNSNLTIIIVIALFLFIAGGQAFAATYYVATNGSDGSAGTSSSPWASFSKAMTVLKPGDMLLIKNGTYYQPLNITVSGTQGYPVTIKSENDGQVVIDGQNSRVPCKIYGSASSRKHDINMEGIICENSISEVFQIFYADRINTKRVSGYDANTAGNYHIFSVNQSTYVLLEDCIATGKGRVMFNIYETQYCTVRRCWGLQEEGQTNTTSDGAGIQIYGSDNCIVENNILGKNTAYSQLFAGVSVWAATYNATANNNTLLGNIVRDSTYKAFANTSASHIISGNSWKNNVAINTGGSGMRCFEHGGDGNLMVENTTCANASGLTYDYYMRSYDEYYTEDPGFIVAGTLKNSSFLNGGTGIYRRQPDALVGALTHKYNNSYNVSTRYNGTTAGTGEKTINPAYNTSTYGKGAYLMVPTALQGQGEGGADIGAEVLYRYQDGVLTDEPLWPWPMEDRIYRETGISVTWESNGGLWKTLNGVYTDTTITPAPSDTQAPTVPTGLAAAVISSSQINLSWAASTDNIGVTGYKVYKNGSLVATVLTKSYSDTGLAASTTYTYSVAAFDAAGNVSGQSATASATTQALPDTQAPSVPTGLTATAASSSQINLAWTASTDNKGVTGYKVYRNGTQIATANTTSYSNAGLTASTSYAYAVAAYDAAGNVSALSASVSAATLASSISTSSSEVIIDNGGVGTASTGTWSPSSGANPYGSNSFWGSSVSTYTWNAGLQSGSYDVYVWWTSYSDRSTSAPVTVKHGTGSKTVYVNQQQNGGKWNYIGTFSFDASTGGTVQVAGTGSSSETVCADAVKFVKAATVTTDTTAPSVPTGLTATAVSTSQINLSWTASTDNMGVAGYKVYRSGVQIATVTSTSYSDTGLARSTAYTYRISAYDAAGNVSAQSASVSARTKRK